MQNLYNKAHKAGMNAANNAQVAPMVVAHTKNIFSNEIDESKPKHFVEDGVCGFAWVNVKPGNSKFANWLKKNDIARPSSYEGGVNVYIHQFGQSLQRKEAYARAFAKVLRDNGISKAYSSSRMD